MYHMHMCVPTHYTRAHIHHTYMCLHIHKCMHVLFLHRCHTCTYMHSHAHTLTLLAALGLFICLPIFTVLTTL